MVDPRRVRQLLDRIAEETERLRRLAEAGADELLADEVRLHAVKYGFIVTIEAALDAGRHLVASEGLRAPDSFAEVFTVLTQADLLPEEVGRAMEEAARFRNLLVHQYAQVDDRRVVEILATRLDDFDAFRRALAEAIT